MGKIITTGRWLRINQNNLSGILAQGLACVQRSVKGSHSYSSESALLICSTVADAQHCKHLSRIADYSENLKKFNIVLKKPPLTAIFSEGYLYKTFNFIILNYIKWYRLTTEYRIYIKLWSIWKYLVNCKWKFGNMLWYKFNKSYSFILSIDIFLTT